MKLTGIAPENRPSLSFGGRVLGKNTHYQANGMEAPFSTAGSGNEGTNATCLVTCITEVLERGRRFFAMSRVQNFTWQQDFC